MQGLKFDASIMKSIREFAKRYLYADYVTKRRAATRASKNKKKTGRRKPKPVYPIPVEKYEDVKYAADVLRRQGKRNEIIFIQCNHRDYLTVLAWCPLNNYL